MGQRDFRNGFGISHFKIFFPFFEQIVKKEKAGAISLFEHEINFIPSSEIIFIHLFLVQPAFFGVSGEFLTHFLFLSQIV